MKKQFAVRVRWQLITEKAVFSPRRREGCGEGGFENSSFVNHVESPPLFYINRLQMFQLEDI